MDVLILDIRDWTKQTNLSDEDPQKQFMKIIEEIGEVARAYRDYMNGEGYRPLLELELGDAVITIITLAEQLDMDIKECMRAAYEKNVSRQKIKKKNDKDVDVREFGKVGVGND